jgi:hypothetical protein
MEPRRVDRRTDECDGFPEPWQEVGTIANLGKEELTMKRQSVITAMVLGVSILSSEAMYAMPVPVHSPVHAMYSTEKLVKFNVHNATTAPIKVKAGDAEMTLPPGKDVPLKLPVGSKVVVQEASTHYTQGNVLTVVSSDLNEATLILH